jgi:Pyruvate/2-oxoacid:ferredoxin oxidoreductase delta subunit
MKVKRKVIEIDEELCNGCGQCITACAEGALQIIKGKARLVSDQFCDGLGACLGECSTDALRVVEREAEDFDEKAVEEHLHAIKQPSPEEPGTMACGCPSAQIRSFGQPGPPEETRVDASSGSEPSALSHWPVQIRLVPPNAPFLKGADLLVAADCTPVAYPTFHRDFLKGKVVMVGCPKFDDVQAYIQKFCDIFKVAGVKSVTVTVMEVPCCQGLPVVVEKGMELSGNKIPFEKVIISAQGEILRREKYAA